MRTALIATLTLLVSIAAPAHAQHDPNRLSPAEQARGWVLLFDGSTTDGWTTSGDPDAWAVRDGELVVAKPGTGWWLRTDRMYRDFELTLEFYLPKGGNSGVGLRSSSNGDPAFTGMEIQIYDTFGQEPTVGSCGAVYNAIAPSSMAVNPPGSWNTYRIVLKGNLLNVWLNGVHIHTDQRLDGRGYFRAPDQPIPLDARCTTGYIALQDHGDPVRFRTIKIRDLSPDPEPVGMVPLCNSKDLSGWTKRGGGTWTIEQGTLVGRDGPGHLFTNETYDNFELRALVRVNDHGNSGMYFRTVPRPEDPDTWPLGYEAQIDNHDPKNFTGCIYDRAWPTRTKPITRDNAWFDYRIRAVGDHIQTWINSIPMVDTTLTDFSAGHFALQTHHQGNEIQYRDIRVLELPKSQTLDPRADDAGTTVGREER